MDLGDGYRHLGRTADAAAAYRKAMDLAVADLGLNYRRATSRVFLGLAAAQLGDRRRAEAELAQSLTMEPENATVMRQAAIGYEVLQQRDKTLAVLRHAPSRLIQELERQPDVRDLQRDPAFRELLAKSKALQ
jgi:tetratricopeptide (TPR) repeat protein